MSVVEIDRRSNLKGALLSFISLIQDLQVLQQAVQVGVMVFLVACGMLHPDKVESLSTEKN